MKNILLNVLNVYERRYGEDHSIIAYKERILNCNTFGNLRKKKLTCPLFKKITERD